MDVLNLRPGGQVKGEEPVKILRSAARYADRYSLLFLLAPGTFTPLARPFCRREEAALRLVLERREAELREAMKLRHSLTTLLHALRVNMEHVSQPK